MNYKQNEKINQVKESTLVVGIDIGSTTQYARAFDWRGIELGKVFTFSNSREGFESFKAWMQHLQDKYRKSCLKRVNLEPSGTTSKPQKSRNSWENFRNIIRRVSVGIEKIR